jgi:hypothetical protein
MSMASPTDFTDKFCVVGVRLFRGCEMDKDA